MHLSLIHIYNEDFDTEGATVEEYKGMQFSYTKNGDEISFFIDAAAAGIQADGMDVTEDYKGSELFCYSYTNKLVPPDYRPTEEDRQAEQNGDIAVSYTHLSFVSFCIYHSPSRREGTHLKSQDHTFYPATAFVPQALCGRCRSHSPALQGQRIRCV